MQVKFQLIGETKGTWKYNEVEDGLNPMRIGVLYIKKTSFNNGAPKFLQVSVTEVEK